MNPDPSVSHIGWHTVLIDQAPALELPIPPVGTWYESFDTGKEKKLLRRLGYDANKLQVEEVFATLPTHETGHWVYETQANDWLQMKSMAHFAAWLRHSLGLWLPFQPLAEAARHQANAFFAAKPQTHLPIFLEYTVEQQPHSLFAGRYALLSGIELLGFSLKKA